MSTIEGHAGVARTVQELQHDWKGIRKDVPQLISKCFTYHSKLDLVTRKQFYFDCFQSPIKFRRT